MIFSQKIKSWFDYSSASYWDKIYQRELAEGRLRRDHELPEQVLRLLEGRDSILDFGSGPGGNVRLLSEQTLNVQFTLLDHSKAALDYARANVLGERDERGNTFRYAESLLECPGDYQAVMSFQVLEHLHGVDEILPALWAKVAPGGILLISVPVQGRHDHNREHINKFTVDSMLERLWKFSPEVTVAPRTYSRKHGRLATAFFHLTKPEDKKETL